MATGAKAVPLKEEVVEEIVETSEVDEVLKEASGQGWVPKEKFKGNEDDWVDAPTFVKRGREILPILRKNNENLIKELNQTKATLAEVRQATDEFKKFQKEAFDRKAKELGQEIEELRSSKAQAIADGDGKRVNALDDAIDSAKEEFRAAKADGLQAARPISAAQLDPKLQMWLDKNDWFGKDKRLTAMTNSLGETLRSENPSLMGDAFLNKLDEALAEEFPQKFGKTSEGKRIPGYQVESGAGRSRTSGTGRRGYEALPTDAKTACDRFVKQKLMTKEQYLSDYDWSE